MYLKSLELQGFKSFPEKIKLDFNKGITAVVGPNGSGKSNIGDAVRWVLGEKSAKSLRGTKMEDIIFNGTENRRPLSFAEVSMIMDNTDRQLNLDYPEITVTRRVYRSGDSDYLINGTKCRAKDILELFMDTGVGKEGYSIIGQGRIEEILSSKSEDRRLLFEEAAGIVKYRTRSNEAINRLAKERDNLVRVNDIISTLETQVGPLEVQAEKAKKFMALTNRLKIVEVNRFVIEADRFDKDINEMNQSIAQYNSDFAKEQKQEEALQQKKSTLKNDLVSVEAQYEENNSTLGEKRSEVEQKENDIRICNTEIQHFNENINRLNSNIDENNKQIEDKSNEYQSLDAKVNARTIELKSKQSVYDTKVSAFSDIESMVNESEEQFNKFNSDIRDKMNRASDVKNEISKSNAMLSQIKDRKSNVAEDISVLRGQCKERETALAVTEKELSRINEDISLTQKNIDESKIAIADCNEKANRGKNRQLELTKAIQDKQSRLKILSELKNSYEGYYGGVKAILSQRDKNSSNFSGICGAVGELLNVSKEYETAIEIALGGAVQNIVAKTESDVKQAISYLKTNNRGRATFLPMTAIKAKTIGKDKAEILSSKGVIGSAKELITYDSQYEDIMSSLLERVIIVDNIDNGIALSKKTKYTYKVVTLDGELFNVGGSMTGGSINKKSTGIFSRERELSELKEALQTLVSEQEELTTTISKLNTALENANESLRESQGEMQQLYIDRTEATGKIAQTKEYVQDYTERIATYEIESKQLNEAIENGEKTVAENEKILAEVNSEIEGVNSKIQEFQTKIQENRSIKEENSLAISNLQLEISQINNDISSFSYNKKRIDTEILQLKSAIISAEKEIEDYKNKIQEQDSVKNSLTEEIKTLKVDYDKFVEEQDKINAYKAEINNSLEELEKTISRQIETKNSLEKQLSRLEMKKEQLENDKTNLYNRMWEEYEITYVVAKGYEKLEIPADELLKEERSLKGQMKALGNVNLNAVEEYAEVSERYNFLIKNRDDIILSEEKLIKVIDQLNVLMEEQFSEQFKLISTNFTETFKEMFGGGQASLKLSDDTDILNCGIEIIVQPPGKALQNMMLLSGGEKALTAISLLFAILKMKPSPFCILDEIEAALDDANVVRYASYLKHFVDTTQFIVVTHRKGTMESADILYGVTMQEKGVSTLLSIQFDDVEELMKDDVQEGA